MPNDQDPEKQDNSKDNNNNRDINPNMPRDQDWHDESNPFVVFRRFADEQVSSLLQSVTGLPSNISRPQSDRWTIFNEDTGYEERKYRERTGGGNAGHGNYARDQDAEGSFSSGQDNNNNGGNTSGPSQPGNTNDRYPRNPHQERNHNPRNAHSDFFGIESVVDRFEDRFFPFSPSFLHPSNRYFFPDMFEDSSSPTWPLTYIAFSPYSPLHLEHQAHYRAQRDQGVFSSIMSSFQPESDRDPNEPQWREAFEDLLRLENGKPMLDNDTLQAGKTENGSDWLHGLVKRGSLGDRWKYSSGGSDCSPWSGITFTGTSHSDGHDNRALPAPRSKTETETENENEKLLESENQEADTELDMYERFLHDIEEREQQLLRGEVGSPLVRFLLEERRREQEQSRRQLYDDDQGTEDTESWLDLADISRDPTPSRVISTMSRTERTRLADGSVETKIVKTKRFADGREETDESVEVTHPRSNDEGSGGPGNQSKGGWFWKD
ncbi:unnamed protein product [Penicillium pancosmium]